MFLALVSVFSILISTVAWLVHILAIVCQWTLLSPFSLVCCFWIVIPTAVRWNPGVVFVCISLRVSGGEHSSFAQNLHFLLSPVVGRPVGWFRLVLGS